MDVGHAAKRDHFLVDLLSFSNVTCRIAVVDNSVLRCVADFEKSLPSQRIIAETSDLREWDKSTFLFFTCGDVERNINDDVNK